MRAISPEWRMLANAVQREVWALSDAVPGLPENLRVLIPLDWPPLPLELPGPDIGATMAQVPVMRTPAVTRPVLGTVLDLGYVVSGELPRDVVTTSTDMEPE